MRERIDTGGARLARWLALIVVGLLPLAFWPGQPQPFSTPKRWILIGAPLAIGALMWTREATGLRLTSRPASTLRALPFVWLASWVLPALFAERVSFDALVTAIGGGLWAIALLRIQLRPRDIATVLTAGGAAAALVAIAQWSGWDAFRAFGWQPVIEGASVRMRVYATFGNPNFAGAFLAGLAPLTASLAIDSRGRLRTVTLVALVLECLAIGATGSRGALLGLVSAAIVWAIVRGGARLIVATAVTLAVVGIFASAARPLAETIQGRFYIWRVIAPHAWAHPLVGFGPGTTESHFLDWERERSQPSATDAVKFGGQPHHADNDYIEALVERGIPGFAAVLIIYGMPILLAIRWHAPSPRDALLAGAAAAVAALAMMSLVDEPLSRPSELMLLWTAIPMLQASLSDEGR